MQRAKIIESNLGFRELTTRTKTDKVVIHHTGAAGDYSAQEIHQMHLNNGWAGCGYHYIVRKDGTIETGRPHWTIGSHAYGENSHTIGIHVAGNFEIEPLNAAQLEAVSILVGTICSDYGIPVDAEHVVGHCDLMATACPGTNLYTEMHTIRGKAIWYQNN